MSTSSSTQSVDSANGDSMISLTNQPIVEVKDLIIEFDTPQGRVRVVDQVNFSVRPGEILGILGESGSGKTMSTQAILGLIDGYPGIMGGEISLYDHSTSHHLLKGLTDYLYLDPKTGSTEKKSRAWQKHSAKQMRMLWGGSVTAIFQNPRLSLDPLMTVGKQIIESIKARSQRAQGLASSPKMTKRALREEAIDWLTRVQMPNPTRVFSSYPHELSGGMCQRAMIAVALACKPKLLIADEPTTGLDATVRAEVVKLLQDLLRTERCAMLYITHDIREMLYLADRVIVMRHGSILESVAKEELRTHPNERATYTQTLLSAAGIGELSFNVCDDGSDPSSALANHKTSQEEGT
jgi:ABC-type dipeptide/oligopeptide/nickel transport system ATPase component